jgi:hypothetical protein
VFGTLCSSLANIKVKVVGFCVLICSNAGWLLTIDKSDAALVGLFGSYFVIAIIGVVTHVSFLRRVGKKNKESKNRGVIGKG